FHSELKTYELPALECSAIEDAYHELELLGFPISLSMFDLLQTSYRGSISAADLNSHAGKIIKMLGRFICEKTVPTKTNKRMWFGRFLDKDGVPFDTVHFPNNTPAYPFRGAGCYLIEGKVIEEFGFASIEVKRFAKLPIVGDPV